MLDLGKVVGNELGDTVVFTGIYLGCQSESFEVAGFIVMWAFPKGNPTYCHRQRAGGMVGVVHKSETSRMGMRYANLTLLNGSLGSTIRFWKYSYTSTVDT